MSDAAGGATFHALVSGMVQGVGFRFFVIQQARHLGLAGRVRNLPDGRVEVRARGEQRDLELLLWKLKQGPPASRVQDVAVQWGAECPETSGFDVGF